MLEFCTPGLSGGPRTYIVPATDITYSATNLVVPSAAIFQMRQRDSLDFSVDATGWLAANGGALLASAAWTVAGGTGAVPTLAGATHDPTGLCTCVVVLAALSLPGDVHYLDWTATTLPTQLATLPAIVIPTRTLTRRITLMVVAG